MRFIVISVAFALSYSTWTILPAIDPNLSLMQSFVSEYAVWGRPGAVVMRIGDGLAGILLIVLAVLLHKRQARSHGVTLGLVVAGLGTLGDTALPFECAPSVDMACAMAEAQGTVGLAHQLHSVTSSIVGCGFAIAVIADSYVLWRSHSQARVLLVLNGVVLALLGMSGVLALMPQTGWAGAFQRVSLAVTCVWILAVGIRHARSFPETTSAGDSSGRTRFAKP